MGLGTIFWVRGTKSTSNRWGGFWSPARLRLSFQTPESDRVNTVIIFWENKLVVYFAFLGPKKTSGLR